MYKCLERLFWGEDPDVRDPTTGLSRRDIYNIQQTWTPVYGMAGDYGLELFKRLFRTSPETKQFFKLIRNLDEEEISKSHQFRAHAINVMSALNMVVTNLTQSAVVAAMVQKLGVTHKGHKVTRKNMDVLIGLILDFFKSDRKLSFQKMESWIRFADYFQKEIYLIITD